MFKKIVLLLSFLPTIWLNAANSSLHETQHLTISSGLSHNGVSCILEDSHGYMWFGTFDGLNRYDGYEFTVFKNSPGNNIFQSSRIRCIAEGRDSNIWIGTEEGVSVFDYKKQSFFQLYPQKGDYDKSTNPHIREIIISEFDQYIYGITSDKDILVFNPNYELEKTIHHGVSGEVNGAFQLNKDEWLLASNRGLFYYSKASKVKEILQEEIGITCHGISRISSQLLSVNTNRGMHFIEYKRGNKAEPIHLISSHLSDSRVRDVRVDKYRNIWVATLYDGLLKYDFKRNGTPSEQIEENVPVTKNIQRVSSIWLSDEYGCWVSTFNSGIFRFKLKSNPFQYYIHDPAQALGMSSNKVARMVSHKKNRVLISCNEGDPNYLNVETGAFEPLPFKIPADANGRLTVLMKDNEKNIWCKVRNSETLLVKKDGERILVQPDIADSVKISKLLPRRMTQDRFGSFWVANNFSVSRFQTDSNGKIIRFEDLNTHPFFKGNPIRQVRYVYLDPLIDYLWVGTDFDGLIRIETNKTKSIRQLEVKQYLNDRNDPKSLPVNFVTSIIRTPLGELWLGTEGGGLVNVKNFNKEPVFEAFTEEDGLSNNVVKNLQYVDNKLWMGTNAGLDVFDLEKRTFRQIRKKDGLPFEDFVFASAKLKDETLLMAGEKGLIVFNPKEVSFTSTMPEFEISNLTIFNKPIQPGDSLHNRVVIKKSISELSGLELKYNENIFSVQVNSLHYSNPESHLIRYQLLPVSENWVETPSSQRIIHFNGLHYGEYTLKVQVSNNMAEWSEAKELAIVITPPWWKTLVARLAYILVLIGVMGLVIFIIVKIKTLGHDLKTEQMEKDKVEEVNAAKLRYFSNISHEIKTPITLILGPINKAADRFKGNNELAHIIHLVQRQAKKITQLIDQVHDFQKANANQLVMRSSNFYFDDLLHEILEDFRFMATNEGKHLKMEYASKKIAVTADKDKLEKILNNLLSNAFKFTQKEDTIEVIYAQEGNNLILKVVDTGKGIEKEDLPHIFERFYQSEKQPDLDVGGSGIGLAFSKRLVEMHYGEIFAESTLGQGTTFTLELPVINNDWVDNEEELERDILKNEMEHNNQAVMQDENPPLIKTEADFKESMVFIVEDNMDMRTFVSTLLSDFFKVKTFVNGKECFTAMENEWPDIIVSDVLMPDMNGFDLCKAVKSNINTSHIPVVLLTASNTMEEQIKGLSLGADAYIKKPFNAQHLVTRIETLLIGRKKLRDRFLSEIPIKLLANDSSSKDFAFLEKLYHLFDENLDNVDVDLEKIARQLYMSRSHFFKKVKVLTGQTPFDLLKMYRLKTASELLINEDLNVNEVIARTGFKSRSHFSNLFKKKYGVTAGQYAGYVKSKAAANKPAT